MRKGLVVLLAVVLGVLGEESVRAVAHGIHGWDETPGRHLFSLQVGGNGRRYLVYVPQRYDPHEREGGGGRLPVVVMLHGGGGTAAAAMKETGWDRKADEEGFLAVFPEGSSFDPSKPSRFFGNPQIWNDGSGRYHAGWRRTDDVAFIAALLDDLARRYRIDPGRIYVTGFSNGASMTYRLGVELSHRVAAIAPVSGHLWLEGDLTLKRGVPFLMIIGLNDPLNPMEGGEVRVPSGRVERHPPVRDSVIRWARMNRCPGEPSVVHDRDGVKGVAYAPCQDGAEVRLYTVEGAGHTWPGGISLLPERLAGSTTNKLNATDLIWEFFRRHPRQG